MGLVSAQALRKVGLEEHGAVGERNGHWCRKETTKMNQKHSRLISNGL